MSVPTSDGEQEPRIAVIVMSHGPRPSLVAAVRSVQSQDVPAEIVVVHSGPGNVEELFRREQVNVRVVQYAHRLLPGATRNVGIAATQAPIVSFLADDCLAAPGSLRERLLAHNNGARAVASALLCHRPDSPLALAAHLSLYVRRMPRTAPNIALRYGVSYARDLFNEVGLFRGDMESGEDTEFNERLRELDEPAWRPNVRTTHVGADTFIDFFLGQVRRGGRMAAARATLGTHNNRTVAINAIARTRLIVKESWEVVDPAQRLSLLLAVPLIALGNVAYAWGAWTWRPQAR